MKYVHYAIIKGQIVFVCMAHWGPNLDLGSVEHAITTDKPEFKKRVVCGGHTFEGELFSVPLEVAETFSA